MKKLFLNKFFILGALALLVVLFFVRSPNMSSIPDLPEKESSATVENEIPTNMNTRDKDGRYHNATFGFSFILPEGYTIGEFPLDPETGGKTFIFQMTEQVERGAQIVVVPFDEPADVVTPERIMKDLPNLRVTSAQEISIGEGGEGGGLLFSSNAPEWGGSSREAWFVKGGGLYQVSTYASNSAFLEEIIATWKFE